MQFFVVIAVLVGTARLSLGAALEGGGSAAGGTRPLMMACTMRSQAGQLLKDLLEEIKQFLADHQPFKLPEAIDILVVRVDNVEVYGLQNAYMREGVSVDCNETAMSFVLTPGIKDVRIVADWTMKAAGLNGKAEITVDLLEVDLAGTVLAAKGSRILADSLRVVTVEGVRAKITGPMSVKAINFNRLIENVLRSESRDEVLRVAEGIAVVTIQEFLDKMSPHL